MNEEQLEFLRVETEQLKEELLELLTAVIEQFKEEQLKCVRVLNERFSTVGQGLLDQLDRLDRKVSAIRSLPVPYGRPRTYHSVTELYSVTNPVRRRHGHQG